MMYLLLALLVLPYACFMFFGEGLNPFSKPSNPSKRNQWRHGRAMAMASLLGILVTIVLVMTVSESLLLSIVIGIASSLVLAAAFSARKISTFFWG